MTAKRGVSRWRFGSLRQAQLERQVEHDVGQLREVVGELFQRQQAGEVLRQQAEHLGVVRFAQQVHLPLGVRLDARPARVAAGRGRPAQSGAASSRRGIEQFVEQHRVALQVVGRPARSADQLRHLLQRLRVLLQQRQIGGAAADGFEQVEAARQRRVRVRRRGGGLDHARHQRIEALADRLRHLLVAAAAARMRGEALRGAARHRGSRGARVRSACAVAVARRARRRSSAWSPALRVGEDRLEMARRRRRGGRRVPPAAPSKLAKPMAAGDQRLVLGVVRQAVRLRVVEVLQAMFEAAQEIVGGGQFDARRRGRAGRARPAAPAPAASA